MRSQLERVELVNRNERRVWAALVRHLRATEMCRCRDCQLDIAALALNAIPARYVVSEEHMTFYGEPMELPDDAVVDAAVRAAAERVAARPHHE